MTHLTDLEVAAFVDHGIPQSQQFRLEQHVQHCSYCASRIEDSRAVVMALADPSIGLWEKIAETVFRLRFSISIAVRRKQVWIDASRFPIGMQFAHQSSGMLDNASSKETITASLQVPDQDNRFLFKLSWQSAQVGSSDVDFQVVDLVEQPIEPHATVQLRKQDSGQMLEWRRTDNNGRVLFKELEMGDYVIQVNYEGLTGEIPFSLKSQGEEKK